MGNAVAAISRLPSVRQHESLVVHGEVVGMIMSHKQGHDVSSAVSSHMHFPLLQKGVHDTRVVLLTTGHLHLVSRRVVFLRLISFHRKPSIRP